MINISLADNQPVVIEGMKCFFKDHSDIAISDSVLFLKDLDYSLKNSCVDILLIDIELEGLNSINSFKRLVEKYPNIKFLIFTAASEKLFGVTALKIGVAGFVSKTEPLQNIEKAIMKIIEGSTAFNDCVYKAVGVAKRLKNGTEECRKLSLRETEVLRHFVHGKKNNEISALLNLNEKTISTYKLRLLNKLHVTNLIDLVSKAKSLEIV